MSAATADRYLARWNRITKELWVTTPEGRVVTRGWATTRRQAYIVLGVAGYVRFDNWLPDYGTVIVCQVVPGPVDA